jgi:hypothetical protein
MSDQPPAREPRHAWTILALFVALTAAMTWPFPRYLANGVLTTGTDTDLTIWILGWDVHAFTHHPWSIFDANIFYPFRHTLAYSENMIGSALLAAPIIWLGGSALLAMNVIVFASIALSGLGAYLLARRLGLRAPAAILCGLVFAFAAPRFLRLDQFHLTTVQWIPFCLAHLHGYFEDGRPRDLRIAIGFFSLQALTSGHGAVFCLLAILVMLADRLVRRTPPRLARRVRDVGVTGALLLVPPALIFLPYRAVQREIGLRRGLDGWDITTSSFVSSPTYVDTWLRHALPSWTWLSEPPDAWLFPGVLPLVLAAAGVIAWRRSRWRPPVWAWAYVALTVLCLWLAVGPPFGLWGWIYRLPGLSFIRVPTRFVIVGMLGLGVLTGVGFERLTRRVPPSTARWLAGVTAALLMAEFVVAPFHPIRYTMEIPDIDRYVATLPGRVAVVDLPLPDSQSLIVREERNSRYMIHSLGHFRPIFEGYSGIQPPGYQEAYWQLTTFPDERSLQTLARLGFTHAILHTSLIPSVERAQVEARFSAFADRVVPIATIGEGRLYELRVERSK